MFTDLFVHQTTHMISAMGVRYPGRVVGGGGLYLEYDGRDVPDVATIVADYDEGCQLIVTATMINAYPIEEVIRGRLGTIKFVQGGFQIIKDDPSQQRRQAGPAGKEPSSRTRRSRPGIEGYTPRGLGQQLRHGRAVGQLPGVRPRRQARDARARRSWARRRSRRWRWACKSYRKGKVLFWDKERAASRSRPTPSWAARLEKRSKERGKPNEIAGCTGGAAGSELTPPDYQKLAGPWVNGKDPAAGA